mgnify:CR=1 FL=1
MVSKMNQIIHSVTIAGNIIRKHLNMEWHRTWRTEGQPDHTTLEAHQKIPIWYIVQLRYYITYQLHLVFYCTINNTNRGIQLDEFKNLCSIYYIALGLSKYNYNMINFTPFQYNESEYYENEGVNNIEFLINRLGEIVQACSMLDNSRLVIIILESSKNQTFNSLTSSILGQVNMMLLCDWLSTVKSDSSTGGACSSSALEILKRRENIRYVFQHNPSYFIYVSYILYFYYVILVS